MPTPNTLSTTTPATSLAPLTIEVGGQGSAPFKSLDHILWENIPPLAVLTGVNGSGKTQLLELLAYKLNNTSHLHYAHEVDRARVTVTGDTFDAGSVSYLPNRWEFTSPHALGFADMVNVRLQMLQLLQTPSPHDLAQRARRARMESMLGKPLNSLNQETFLREMPADFTFMLEETDPIVGLVHVFMAYRVRFIEELEQGTLPADIPAKIGLAPWNVVNETFEAAEFPYRVVSPRKGLLDPYVFRLENPQTGVLLDPQDLSSGEKKILGVVIWLYNSQHHGRFPRLFLLDEPDAHLHPSMTRQFMSVIKEVLVDRYNVRVIMSTHSPSTVALAPEGSLFEMSKTPPRITPSKSKAHTIGLLTAGIVIVSPSTRYVLVEDEDDVDFYGAIRDLLSDYGPSRDPRAIKPSPSIVFMPASRGGGQGKVGGGRSVVTQWVENSTESL